MPVFERPAGALAYDVAGDGQPVVLLAGLGFDRAAWGYQTPALAGDCRVITVDNRGVGGSFVPEGEYVLSDMARDVVDLLDHLEVATASLVGMSLGGMIAQHVAAEYGNRVNRLALVTTTARPDAFAEALFAALEGVALDEGLEQMFEHLLLWSYTPRFFSEHAPLLAALRRTIAQHLPTEDGVLGRLAAVRACNTEELLTRIQAPALILAAEEDRIFPPPHAEALAARLPNARLQTVPGGHACAVEQAEAVNVALADFLLDDLDMEA